MIFFLIKLKSKWKWARARRNIINGGENAEKQKNRKTSMRWREFCGGECEPFALLLFSSLLGQLFSDSNVRQRIKHLHNIVD